jgi:hypothetical protein
VGTISYQGASASGVAFGFLVQVGLMYHF